MLDSTGALAVKEVRKRMLILGGSMVGPHTGDMIDKVIYPHPKLGESIGMAAEVAHGNRTDLSPARK